MSAAPLVSIVVPTCGRPNALTRCLDSIAANAPSSHETICVASDADETTRDTLRLHEVRTVVQPGRQGFVRAANAGFRAARGRWLLQLNDDCRLLPHSVANAIRFLEAPSHSGIGQAAFFHDTPVSRNVFQQIELDGRWFRVLHVRGLCYANFGLVRRDLAERIGYYDERFHMYGADPDFSLKIWHDAKLEVRPCPGSLVEHDEVVDERAALERPAQHADNATLFAKWPI
ncbi:MAG: glycosyltransferase [Phycisphaerae bacterium]|nr:glycosyltransferase [Phycisphaerae bacterium]